MLPAGFTKMILRREMCISMREKLVFVKCDDHEVPMNIDYPDEVKSSYPCMGKDAPKVCPLCGYKGSFFEVKKNNY